MNIAWTPSVEVETASGTREVSLNTRHLSNRTVFLTGEIGQDTANSFLSQMLYLQEKDEPVTIYINSPGGEISAGLMIYDIIQQSPLDITLICAGLAASMAAVLLAGGRKGKRFILPHSEVMIHEPLLSRGVGGSASSIKNISDSILATRELMNSILAQHTGKTRKEIDKATAFDHFMNAEEAVKFGICDAVYTGKKEA